jgi:hypothetical protein
MVRDISALSLFYQESFGVLTTAYVSCRFFESETFLFLMIKNERTCSEVGWELAPEEWERWLGKGRED